MQLTIERDVLLRLLRLVAGVVERRNTQVLPILSHVLIECHGGVLSLTSTDQEIELKCSLPLSGEDNEGDVAMTVSFRKLNDICRALPEGATIRLTDDSERVVLRSGRSRFVLSHLPVSSFPLLGKMKQELKFALPKKQLRELIEKTAFAMAEQDVRYYLNGMLLEVKEKTLYSVAADGHRLAISSMPLEEGHFETMRVIVPRKGVLELMRLLEPNDDMVELVVSERYLRIRTDGFQLTTKLLDGKFPDYERVIPNQGNKIIVSSRLNLKEAFLRAGALFNDKFKGIRLRLSENCLKILANNKEQDEVEEDLEVDYQGESLDIGFNVSYLIDSLSAIQSEQVKLTFSDPDSSALVESVEPNQGRHVIMPMRI